MSKETVQIKFTINSDIVSLFKARCASEGVSMTSVICQWMKTGHPTKSAKVRTDTRPLRKKTVLEMIDLLTGVLQKEETYRDAIPEKFQARYETADQTCEQLSQALSCLEEAF
jgi:hypothetical protein